jgi:hypothetical protein
MPKITESTLTTGYLDDQRESIKGSLNEITNDIGMAMRDAGLGSIPIYMVIPKSGDALASLATPVNPSEEEWSCIMDIAFKVIQEKIGCGELCSRALSCAAVNEPMVVADVKAE